MWKARFVIAALLLVAAFNVLPASAAAATLSVDPGEKEVAQGEQFTLSIKLNTDVALSGVQTDIEFDRSLLQIVDITKAGAFENATFLVGVAPQTKAEAIAEANTTTGKLKNAAVFFLPGGGGATPGDSEAFTVTFAAGTAGGESTVTLSSTSTTDDQGSVVLTTGGEGTVTIAGPTASPTPVGQTPTDTPSPTPVPSVTPSPSPTLVPVASIAITPATFAARPGSEYVITLTQNTNQPTLGSQASLKFDPAMFQIVSVTKGAGFAKASLVMGIAPATGQAAIDAANASGLLSNIGGFVIPPATIAAGESAFVTVKVKANAGANGKTKIELTGLEMINNSGDLIGVTGTGADAEISVNAPISVLGPGSFGGQPEGHSAVPAALWVFGAIVAMAGAFVMTRVARKA